MFTVIASLLIGIVLGYLLRSRKISFIHRIVVMLIWTLLFLLGLELGANEAILRQFGSLGLEAFLLAAGGTLGSVLLAWLLWLTVQKKETI